MTPTAVIETPRIEAEQQAVSLFDQAKGLTITSNDDRGFAEEMIQTAKKLEDEIFGYLDPPRDRAYRDYQYHKKRLDDAIKPVQEARKMAKQKCISYDQEQERIRQEEQRKAEEEARKRAEQEQLEAAIAAEQSGEKEVAEQILSEPVQVAPVSVPRTAPAPSRLSAGRTQWYAEVNDIKALCKAIAEGKQPATLVTPNLPALNKMALALKTGMNVPGVVAKSKTV